MNCLHCTVRLTDENHDEDSGFCRICDMVVSQRGPAAHGTADGHGGHLNDGTHYCTPNPYKETLKALRKAEEYGRLTPKLEQIGRKRLERLEPFKDKKVDYNHTGGPSYDS
jgi:hypothetical protein